MPIQVIVRSAAPAPARPRAEEPLVHDLGTADLDRAEKQSPFKPRADGVYLSVPTCSPKDGWSRVALRFFENGNAAISDGNLSAPDAVILTSDHWTGMRTGSPCTIKGARVRCELGFGLDEPAPDPKQRRTSLDGVTGTEWLDVLLSPADGRKPAGHALRFFPLAKDRMKELEE